MYSTAAFQLLLGDVVTDLDELIKERSSCQALDKVQQCHWFLPGQPLSNKHPQRCDANPSRHQQNPGVGSAAYQP